MHHHIARQVAADSRIGGRVAGQGWISIGGKEGLVAPVPRGAYRIV